MSIFKAKTAFAFALVAFGLGACSTVRPQERAVLADPSMQFESEAEQRAAVRHALENREGARGGAEVSGGGCGCN